MDVYKITNKINGKSYIGQTIRDVETRWIEHCENKSHCHALKAAIDLYGKTSFTVEILHEANSIEELNKKEKDFIKEFNTLAPNGYNLTEGGDRAKFSEQTRARMSTSRQGSKHHMFGKTHSETSKRRMSLAKLNPVMCKETGQVFANVFQASKAMNLCPKYIAGNLKGKKNRFNRPTFSYVEKSNVQI